MRPQKVKDRELIDMLFSAIRARGYSGASISELSAETGLKKASLYHRFPGGKEDIVRAVLKEVITWSEKNIAGVLESPNLDADTRLELVLSNISTLYKGSKKNCVFAALSLENGLQLFGNDIKKGLRIWIGAFTNYGRSIGLTQLSSEKKANEVVSLIQGSLVVCRIMEDKSAWNEAMRRIEEIFKY